MSIVYRHIDTLDEEIVSEMIQNLYKEDNSIKLMTAEKIRNTFDTIKLNPGIGSIIVIEKDGNIAGYSILINFWSNEYGGNILFIDELYVKKEFRKEGIGTNFIKHLKETKFGNSVALQLHITSKNIRARKLYESLGFKPHQNETLTCEL